MARKPVVRVHWLQPATKGSLRRIACHLKAGPGEFTSDPLRVTCNYCQAKPGYRNADLAMLAEQMCTCGHRRGQHLGKRGEGLCVQCDGSTLTGGAICMKFERRKETGSE